MNSPTPSELVPVAGMSAPAAPPKPPSPWDFVQDRMNGRWKYAIPLALICGVAGAGIAFLLAPAKYVAKGSIQVNPIRENVLSTRPDVVPAYDLMVEMQVQIVQMESTLQRALNSREALAGGLAEEFASPSALKDALSVNRGRNSPFVHVWVESDDPNHAYVAAKSILEAYQDELSPQAKYQSDLAEVDQFIAEAQGNIDTQLRRRSDPADQNSPFVKESDERLLSIRQTAFDQFNLHWQLLNAVGPRVSLLDFLADGGASLVERMRAARPEQPGTGDASNNDGAAPSEPDAGAREPTDEQLADFNEEFKRLQTEVREQEEDIRDLLVQLGPEHRNVRDADKRLSVLKSDRDRARDLARLRWLDQQATGTTVLRGGAANDPAQLQAPSPEDVEYYLVTCVDLWAAIDRVDAELSRRAQIDEEINSLRQHLDRYKNKRKELEENREALVQGTTQIHLPIIPQSPEKTKKRQFAVAGFLGGCGFPIALFLLIGHVDRRAFGTKQLAPGMTACECVGVLPDLTRLEDDLETRKLAASCIHRLRNRLELSRVNAQHFTVAVSSPFQGDGKTSLAFALAWSYASSGFRTVMVDADFVGETLSSQMGLLRTAGFRELLAGSPINGQVKRVPGRNQLSVLGAGMDARIGPETVTRADVMHVLNELRLQFDIIIIDTGPLLGSVEALPVVSAADGVLLTLRRGRPKRRLDECVEELTAVGAHALGVVLNCADASECRRYTSTSRVSARQVSENGAAPSDDLSARGAEASGLIRVLRESEASETSDSSSAEVT